jgi:hypothetical protein
MDNINYILSDKIAYTVANKVPDSVNDKVVEYDINLYNLEEEYGVYDYNTDIINNDMANDYHYDYDIANANNAHYNELCALYMSYSVKSLVQIMHYYGIHKKRLLKDEIILLLINFELDYMNNSIVVKRRRLWENIAELSADSYFKSFITFTV